MNGHPRLCAAIKVHVMGNRLIARIPSNNGCPGVPV